MGEQSVHAQQRDSLSQRIIFIGDAGEQKNNVQFYQDQFAQTIAKLLGFTYKASHPISPEIKSVIKK